MTDLDAPTTAELIAKRLRYDILSGKLKPLQPLRQDEIAAQMGVSKIPTREALVQLKTEGLVVIHQNRGAVVAEFSASEVAEVYEMRAALETLAIRRAIPNMTKSDFVRAEGLIEIMDDTHDALNWSELNWEFHAMLYRPANMPRLLEHIRMLHSNVARYVVHYLTSVDYHAEAQRQHRLILQLCRTGNIAQATPQLEAHLTQAGKKIAQFLKKDEG
ncbi:MAG: GntR family transcriptional regulator [Chloroflexi bacterium]|nr:GntR family transcriptional regulator [Chloroflexota bacterium]